MCKNHGIHFCVVQLFLDMGPALQCGSYTQWHSVGETGLVFPSRCQFQITSWEGVGFCVHLSLLPFNLVPVEEEKRLSRGLGASSANYQGLITCTECSLVTCWLGIRKSSSHETRLSINLSASRLPQNRKWPPSGRISQGKLPAHWVTPSK